MELPNDPQNDRELARSATGGPTTGGSTKENFDLEIARADFLDFLHQEYNGVIACLVIFGAGRQDAEEAVQEAFLDAWQVAITPGEWETIYNPRGWIRTVALRKYQRPPGLRRRVSTFPVPDITAHETLNSSVDHSELTVHVEVVRSTLRNLDPTTQTVMALYIDGFSAMEIAVHLDIKVQKVYDLIKKGRKALSDALELTAFREHDRRIR